MNDKNGIISKKSKTYFQKFKNMSFKQKATALVLATIAFVSGGITISTTMERAELENIKKNIASSEFLPDSYGSIDGEMNISSVEKEALKKQDFVFVSVADDVIPSDELNKAKDESKSIGLIVKPTGYTYASIYKTIDKVKEIVSNYNISCPILYDISTMMGEDTIRANCLLAEEFCNKLSANGCYVGLYGTNDDMAFFSNKFAEVTETHSLDLYDKMIASDSTMKNDLNTIEHDNSCNMIQLSNGVVLWKYKLNDIIQKNELNKSNRFINEFVYTVESGDNLYNIASCYNMKVADLFEYNDLDSSTIYPGDEIIVPNNYTYQDAQKDYEVQEEYNLEIHQTQRPDEIESETLNRIVKGIDVSEFQQEIDWDETGKDIDFAIIRMCDFSGRIGDSYNTDEQFDRNMNTCEELNIPLGVYYFSRATSPEEAREEAILVAEKLKPYSLEYPVYMDVETDFLNNMMKNNPKEFEEIADAAMGTLKEEGYYPGIYANKTFASNVLYLSDKYSFWLTSNETYDTSVNFDSFKNPNYNLMFMPNNQTQMYQYCQRGQVDGIYGEVDVDYATKTLTKTIVDNGYSKPKI